MYPLGGGVRGDPANSVLARIGGGELAVSVRTPFFFSQVSYRIEIK